MEYDELAPLCMEALTRAKTVADVANIRMAARFAWERKEMGGEEHWLFAHRNGTPIVPPGHECHPIELVKRGYVDGKGWPKPVSDATMARVRYFRWPDGEHFYASIDGIDITDGARVKFNSQPEAEAAARKFIAAHDLN